MRLCIGYAGSRHSSAVHKRCIGSAFRRRVEWEQGALRAFDTAVEATGFEEIGALATVNSFLEADFWIAAIRRILPTYKYAMI